MLSDKRIETAINIITYATTHQAKEKEIKRLLKDQNEKVAEWLEGQNVVNAKWLANQLREKG